MGLNNSHLRLALVYHLLGRSPSYEALEKHSLPNHRKCHSSSVSWLDLISLCCNNSLSLTSLRVIHIGAPRVPVSRPTRDSREHVCQQPGTGIPSSLSTTPPTVYCCFTVNSYPDDQRHFDRESNHYTTLPPVFTKIIGMKKKLKHTQTIINTITSDVIPGLSTWAHV